MAETNITNRIEVTTLVALTDPRDGYPKTVFYFNKFENNKGYDCYALNETTEECVEIMTIDEDDIISITEF